MMITATTMSSGWGIKFNCKRCRRLILMPASDKRDNRITCMKCGFQHVVRVKRCENENRRDV